MALGILHIGVKKYRDNGEESRSYYSVFGLYREYGFGHVIIRSPCTPDSIYLRGTITLNPKP